MDSQQDPARIPSLGPNSYQETQERDVLINPITELVMDLELFLNRPAEAEEYKGGQPPAAKSAVEAMPRVEIREEGDLAGLGGCVICLEGYKVGTTLKKMPCQHGFHQGCIEKWLGLHGSYPVCRFIMPVDDGDDLDRNRNADGDDVDSVQFDWFGDVDHSVFSNNYFF